MPALLASVLVVGSCGDSPNQSGRSTQRAVVNQGKVYSMDDVNRELRDAGVQPYSTQDVAREFFKAHPAYTICNDFEGGIIAVVRNRTIDPNTDDQYIIIGYREGKLESLDIGPPQFSVGNVASYCP